MLRNNKENRGFTLHHFPRSRRRDLIKGLSPKNVKNGEGFTLIELMVVVFIVSIGIVGVMNLIMQIFLYTRLNQTKLTASFLAQEGIEIVRNIRDTNWVEGAPTWNEGLPVSPLMGYGLDYQTIGLPDARCDPDPTVPLRFDGSFYTCEGTPDQNTKFKRRVTIEGDPASDELVVRVSVTWDGYEVKAMEKIYNWYQP